ncbi:hypothetical protein ACHAPV_009667 [Trichoderma viride]
MLFANYLKALLIIDQCSKVFFDRTQPTDDRPEVMDLFAQDIGTVGHDTSSAYSDFLLIKPHSSSMAKSKNPQTKPLQRLNVRLEGILLKKSKDIMDELKINFEEAADLIENIENRTAEINNLQSTAAPLNEQLQALLSLKQQEISIAESRAALLQGEETVNQGRAIMAFTIVTIFFVSPEHSNS